MAHVIVADDCGNAPKKALIRDFKIAFANQDIDAIRERVTEDVRWTRIGDVSVEGKDAVASALREMAAPAVTQLVIDNIITHGNVGAANGIMVFADGSTCAFCDVYRFGSFSKTARIKEVTSYVIPVRADVLAGRPTP